MATADFTSRLRSEIEVGVVLDATAAWSEPDLVQVPLARLTWYRDGRDAEPIVDHVSVDLVRSSGGAARNLTGLTGTE